MTPPTVLVPAFERVEASRRALASLRSAGAERILLIDDEGRGSGAELAAEFPGLDVLRTERPLYWTGAVALAIDHCFSRGDDAVLLFNQDVTCAPNYFERLARTASAYPDALIGSAVCYAHDPQRVWSAGGLLEWWGRGIRVAHHGAPVSSLPTEPYPVDWLFGMGTYVPRSVQTRVGLPDGERFPMAWGDTDFSLRAKERGVQVILDPGLRLEHEVGAYDAWAAGPPTLRCYLGWLGSPTHNLSLSAHAEIWRRHGPRFLWPLSLALRVTVLFANYVRIRVLFPVKAEGE